MGVATFYILSIISCLPYFLLLLADLVCRSFGVGKLSYFSLVHCLILVIFVNEAAYSYNYSYNLDIKSIVIPILILNESVFDISVLMCKPFLQSVYGRFVLWLWMLLFVYPALFYLNMIQWILLIWYQIRIITFLSLYFINAFLLPHTPTHIEMIFLKMCEYVDAVCVQCLRLWEICRVRGWTGTWCLWNGSLQQTPMERSCFTRSSQPITESRCFLKCLHTSSCTISVAFIPTCFMSSLWLLLTQRVQEKRPTALHTRCQNQVQSALPIWSTSMCGTHYNFVICKKNKIICLKLCTLMMKYNCK